MTLTELRYIVTLAEEKHFGKAAERCFVSQPTLSIAVKKLEDELNVSLFERNKGQIQITPLGEIIVAQAEQVLNEAKNLEALAQTGKDPLKGLLKIGAIYTIGPYLFPHLIPQMKILAPEMPLFIEENYTSVLRNKLKRGELDVIIIALPFTDTDVLTKTLYEEPFSLLLPSQHPLTKKTQVEGADLIDEQLLLLGSGHCFRDQILDSLPDLRQSMIGQQNNNNMAEGSSLETLRHMVASGLGLTILPQTATGTQHYANDLLTTLPFKTPAPQRTVALAWRASFTRPQVIDALHQAILACQLFP